MGSEKKIECPRCEGSGELLDAYWTCGDPDCCGSGNIECPDCEGTGKASPTPEAPQDD